MSPEEYAALLSVGKVTLRRDVEGNYIYDAQRTSTAVLPRDIIQQLETQRLTAVLEHEKRLKAFDLFITALKLAV
jgi:hypothetical protein